MSIINEIITKSSNSHQIKHKGNNLTYTSLEKICNWITGRQKRAKRCDVQKYVSTFENN